MSSIRYPNLYAHKFYSPIFAVIYSSSIIQLSIPICSYDVFMPYDEIKFTIWFHLFNVWCHYFNTRDQDSYRQQMNVIDFDDTNGAPSCCSRSKWMLFVVGYCYWYMQFQNPNWFHCLNTGKCISLVSFGIGKLNHSNKNSIILTLGQPSFPALEINCQT